MDVLGLTDASKICINVENIPEQGCQQMFYGCNALINPPQINVVNLETKALNGMFQNCTNLLSAPVLSSIITVR